MSKNQTSGFAAILERDAKTRSKRISDKIPQWAEYADSLQVPSSLNLEQCSSGEAAEYKATIAARLGACRIADLTGGLGVDCWAFCRNSDAVLHNERDVRLGGAVAANFRTLGIRNTEFRNFDITPPSGQKNACTNAKVSDGGNASGAGNGKLAPAADAWTDALRVFAPDLIFADPARRDGCGNKVFLPGDCSPDITALMPLLLDIAPKVMVKFSPMMDITALRECFGDTLKQIHIVCVGGEAKELLCIFTHDKIATGLTIFDRGKTLELDFDAELSATAKYPDSEKDLPEFLFEPGPGLLKAGLFKYICSHYGMTKIGRNTHLYLSTDIVPELEAFGKFFRITKIRPFCKESFRLIATDYPHADLTARNLPVSTDELRKKIKITPGHNGSGVHIFATTVDYVTESVRRMFVTETTISKQILSPECCIGSF